MSLIWIKMPARSFRAEMYGRQAKIAISATATTGGRMTTLTGYPGEGSHPFGVDLNKCVAGCRAELSVREMGGSAVRPLLSLGLLPIPSAALCAAIFASRRAARLVDHLETVGPALRPSDPA